MSEGALRRAKDILWESLMEDDKEYYIRMATEEQHLCNCELAAKCVDETNAAMNAPGYVSHLDCGPPKKSKKK